MVALASPRNGAVPDVLPVLRPPLGGKVVTPRGPREKPAGIPRSGLYPRSGGAPAPEPIAPVAPGDLPIGPGKTIASVLRSSFPPAGALGYAPEEAASWPETRWKRERTSEYDECQPLSPRGLAPTPPSEGPPPRSARRPAQRTQSEGVNGVRRAPARPSGQGYPCEASRVQDRGSGTGLTPRRPRVADERGTSPGPTPRGGDTGPCLSSRSTARRPPSLPKLDQDDSQEATGSNDEALRAAPQQQEPPAAGSRSSSQQPRGPQGRSAKEEAKLWFKNFLVEAESEVKAVEAAKEARAASPARCLIAELEQERLEWEERSRKLLLSRGGEPARPQEGCEGEVQLQDAASSASCAEPFVTVPVTDAEVVAEAARTAEACASEAACHEEEGQIAVALRAAGLEPGLEAACALAAAASASPPPLEPVVEDDCPVQPDDQGSVQWSSSARQWAASRLRRKRARGLGSRPGTPSGAVVDDLAADIAPGPEEESSAMPPPV